MHTCCGQTPLPSCMSCSDSSRHPAKKLQKKKHCVDKDQEYGVFLKEILFVVLTVKSKATMTKSRAIAEVQSIFIVAPRFVEHCYVAFLVFHFKIPRDIHLLYGNSCPDHHKMLTHGAFYGIVISPMDDRASHSLWE